MRLRFKLNEKFSHGVDEGQLHREFLESGMKCTEVTTRRYPDNPDKDRIRIQFEEDYDKEVVDMICIVYNQNRRKNYKTV